MKGIVIGILTIFLISGCIGSFGKIIIDDDLYKVAERDSIEINNIQLIKDIIHFNISYGGGCEEHVFELLATSFMESYPIQVNIVLSHEDNDDPCDMWITKTLSYNLMPLKESYQDLYNEKSGIIIMNIEDWYESISYDF